MGTFQTTRLALSERAQREAWPRPPLPTRALPRATLASITASLALHLRAPRGHSQAQQCGLLHAKRAGDVGTPAPGPSGATARVGHNQRPTQARRVSGFMFMHENWPQHPRLDLSKPPQHTPWGLCGMRTQAQAPQHERMLMTGDRTTPGPCGPGSPTSVLSLWPWLSS